MQDLNDKINDGGATANGVLPAGHWNEVASELQNLITSTGATLSSGDLLQLVKAVALYAHNGNFYTTGGTANAITLNPVGSYNAPTTYTDGMQVRFVAGSSNTGTATINVNGIGASSLLDYTGAALTTGNIYSGRQYTATYKSSSSSFLLDFSTDAREVLIASGTFSGASSLQLVLSTLDPVQATTNEYRLIVDHRPSASGVQPAYTISSNAGSTYVSTGYYSANYGIDSGGAGSFFLESNGSSFQFQEGGGAPVAGHLARLELRLLSMNTGTSVNPRWINDKCMYFSPTLNHLEVNDGAVYNSTPADYDALKLTMPSGTFAEGYYRLYKIR